MVLGYFKLVCFMVTLYSWVLKDDLFHSALSMLYKTLENSSLLCNSKLFDHINLGIFLYE